MHIHFTCIIYTVYVPKPVVVIVQTKKGVGGWVYTELQRALSCFTLTSCSVVEATQQICQAELAGCEAGWLR